MLECWNAGMLEYDGETVKENGSVEGSREKWIAHPHDLSFVVSITMLSIMCLVMTAISIFDPLGHSLPGWMGIIALLPILALAVWGVGVLQMIFVKRKNGKFRIRSLVLLLAPVVLFSILFIAVLFSWRSEPTSAYYESSRRAR
ncbi:MAG: hypothetical protein AAB263_09870 [Planctomycetota bacterium]